LPGNFAYKGRDTYLEKASEKSTKKKNRGNRKAMTTELRRDWKYILKGAAQCAFRRMQSTAFPEKQARCVCKRATAHWVAALGTSSHCAVGYLESADAKTRFAGLFPVILANDSSPANDAMGKELESFQKRSRANDCVGKNPNSKPLSQKYRTANGTDHFARGPAYSRTTTLHLGQLVNLRRAAWGVARELVVRRADLQEYGIALRMEGWKSPKKSEGAWCILASRSKPSWIPKGNLGAGAFVLGVRLMPLGHLPAGAARERWPSAGWKGRFAERLAGDRYRMERFTSSRTARNGKRKRRPWPLIAAMKLDADWKTRKNVQATGDEKIGTRIGRLALRCEDRLTLCVKREATARLMLVRAAANKGGARERVLRQICTWWFQASRKKIWIR